MIALHLIEADKAEAIYPYIKQWVEPAVATSNGKFATEDVLRAIMSGAMQLWVIADERPMAIVISEIAIFPRMKVCRLICCTGEHREKWIHFLADIENWARHMGCEQMLCIARKGWARLLTDYKLTHVELEKAL